MGNTICYSCSSSQEQNEISTVIIPALEGMQSMDKVEELIAYIDQILSNIGREGQGQVGRPNSVASSITSGSDLIEKLSKRLKRNICKKCFYSVLERETRKVVVEVVNQAQPILGVGIALSMLAHMLERAEQASSNKEQCLNLLCYMSVLAKHIKNLDIHLGRAKLDDILCFIVKGTLMCALLMQPNRFCRFIFAPLDAADLEKLKTQLLFVYPDLALVAVTEVFNRLPIDPGPSQGKSLPEAVVLKDAQNAVTELLDLTESSFRVVVIYGVGGIGKTTLATAVFKSLDLTGYRYCRVDMDQDCKLSDIQAMQEQILSHLFNEKLKLNNRTQGREELSKAFGKALKPVFLFVDNALRHRDVEELLPMQSLSGLPTRSRILLTTRSLQEANIFPLGIQVHSHRVDSLPEPEAKRLLCHYALGDADGSFAAGVHTEGLLQVCGGIPLVLQIVGSRLRTDGDTPSACNKILEYYEQWQQKGFEGGEDVSERMVDFVYRELKEPSRESFLDIVFFFSGWERCKVADIVGEMQLRDLEGAALVTSQEVWWESFDRWNRKVKKKKTVVKVHDIVGARGRKLSEGNRITNIESLSILLGDKQKLQQTKGIWLDEGLSVEAKHLDLMSRSLRVLFLGGKIGLTGRCERVFEDLRFLYISYEDMLPIDLTKSRQLVYFKGYLNEGHIFPELPESLGLLDFCARRTSPVVLVDIIKGHLTEIKLKNITLANFENSITQHKSLRSLELQHCEGFTSIPESFGNISSLQTLKMRRCSQLEGLPESFGNISSLQTLDMSGCSKLEGLPESFGNISSLQTLLMYDCSKLERLPESFGNISSLQTLHMSRCSKLEGLPESFGNISSLQTLDMAGCSKLEGLPESFGNISSLQTLLMSGCYKLERLPESFGNISSLQTLLMSACSKLERLPESFGNISSLQTLLMYDCSKLERLPESFGNISSLQILLMSGCSKLEGLPESFGNISSLQTLHMSGCSKLEGLPESFGNISSLQRLDMSGCSKLEGLPESFGNITSLQRLDMSGCSKLEGLPESFGNISSLQTLDMSGCFKLEGFLESFGNISSLQTLNISEWSMLERLPNSLGNLSSLKKLFMHKCSNLERLPQKFDQLSCLETLELDDCEKMCSLSDNFGQLKCLKFLSIKNCKELKRLPEDIQCSTSLAAMSAYGCLQLEAKAMDSLVKIKSLMFLEMGESPNLIKRWEEIQQHSPIIGAALSFEHYKYPYEEIMSGIFFNGESRFVHVDGEGQLVEVASSSFAEVGVKVGLLMVRACHLSNEEVRQKLDEVASCGYEIIYVDVDVGVEGEWKWEEVEGSSSSRWKEEREQRIKKTLLQLPQGSRAWTSLSRKHSLLFAYSLWLFTGSVVDDRRPSYYAADVSIVGTSVLVDEEGRRKLSPLEMKFPTREEVTRDRTKSSSGEELRTLFYPFREASEWMVRPR